MVERWRGENWAISVNGDRLELELPSGVAVVPSANAASLRLFRRWFRWRLAHGGTEVATLRSLGRADALRLHIALRRLVLEPELAAAVAWADRAVALVAKGRSEQRWITTESVQALQATRPVPGLLGRVRAAGCEHTLEPAEHAALHMLDADLAATVQRANAEILGLELRDRRAFFDTIESSPLTEEQARAVICMDSRVQVLAAAGSGKTSLMVARAAYAVHRGWVAPDRILLLAFNRNAAEELERRIIERFTAAGIDATGVRASTFHSLGLEVIGRATGRKPRPAGWLDGGQDIGVVVRLADELRDRSPTDLEEHQPDGWDPNAGREGYRTLGGEVVKSHGERLVADFLFLNGVDYVYERPYDIDTATADHAQYRPDFYYPEIDTWHEHWAVDVDGNPPGSFEGYADAMAWKRDLHAAHGTTLIETTFAEVVFRNGLEHLAARLTEIGLTLDWNPDRPPRDRYARVTEHEDVARLIRTFMAHVKSNGLTRVELEQRAGLDLRGGGYRSRLFLDIYWEIHEAWQQRLADDGSVDFEDMLVEAAGHLEQGADLGTDLVMVDEFQDASQARARLVRGLVSRPGRHLLTVGDDWQAINRFAGADLGVMTAFTSWFGPGPQLQLTATFRCPQRVADVARRFVTRNPAQFDKPMRSAQDRTGPPVRVVRTGDSGATIRGVIEDLASRVDADRIAEGRPVGDPVTVMVLGRYRFEQDLVRRGRTRGVAVEFHTVHGSKGLEADHVIVANLGVGTYGFPSTISDDPVLRLAMPSPEDFPHAEERRLLYVALTRAKQTVTLIVPTDRMSPFAVELVSDPDVVVEGGSGDIEVCDACGQGTMVVRRRRDGAGRFLGCSTFPRCKNTRNLA